MEQYDNIIKKFVKSLDLDGSKEDMDAVVSEMKQKVQQIVVHTMIQNMSPEQRMELHDVLSGEGNNIEETISQMASSIPGLWIKIEEAIEADLESIRDMFKKDN